MSYAISSIERLKADRAAAWHRAQTILERANRAGRRIDVNERAEVDRIDAEIDRIDAEVHRLEADTFRAPAAHILQPAFDGTSSADGAWDDLGALLAGRARSIDVSFRGLQRTFERGGAVRVTRTGESPLEHRDLMKVTSAGGGATVPTSFSRQLYEFLTEASSILALNTTVLNTSSGENFDVPTLATNGTAAIVGEGTAIAEADPTYSKVTLGAYKYGQLLQVSNELLSDSGVDMQGHIARNMAQALSVAYGSAMMNGTGTNAPHGVLAAAATGVTGQTGATGVPSYANLVDMLHSVSSLYRRRAYWLWKDSTVASIRKITDTTGRPIWEPSVQAGQPDMLLGHPVVTDPFVAAAGTGIVCGAFGDFSGYYVRMTPVNVVASPDFALDKDLTTFRATVRIDGKAVDTAAYRAYRGGTS